MRKVLKSLVSLLVIATMLLSMASVSFASTVETTGAISLSTDGIEEVTFGDETFTGVVVTAKASVQDEYFAGWGEGAVAYNASLFEFVGAEKLQFVDAFGSSCEWTLFDVFDEPANSKVVVGIGVGDNVGIGDEDFSAGVPYGEAEMVKLYFRVKDGADTAGKTANFEAEGSLIYWDWENNLNNEMDAFGFMKNMNYTDAPVEFAPAEYTITYIADGETVGTQSYVAGAAIDAMEAPAKEGYTFEGWEGFPEDGLMPAESITVTAIYEEIPVTTYTITYVIDGETIGTQTYEAGQAISALAAPAKEGYKFDGWANIPATMPAENITVTGSYSEIPATNPSGMCGTNVSWVLDMETGVLTISGTGAMKITATSSVSYDWEKYYADDIKSVVVEEGVTTIANYAFDNVTALTEVTLPSTLTTIGAAAFRSTALETITMPLVDSVGNAAFNKCESLKTVIATGLKADFYDMSIGKDNTPLFSANWTITEPSGNIIHASMYGPARWVYDEGMKKMHVFKNSYASSSAMQSFDNVGGYKKAPWRSYLSTVEEIEIGDGLTAIIGNSFRDSPTLKNIIISEGVTTIGAGAFSSLKSSQKLETVTLPSTLTALGAKTFFLYKCHSLSKVNINMTYDAYQNVSNGGNNVFFNKTFTEFTDAYAGWHSNATWWKFDKASGVLTLINKKSTNGSMSAKEAAAQPWYSFRDQVTSIVIPRYTTQIGQAAFAFFKNVTNVTLPNTVNRIEKNAFRFMDNLEEMTFTNSVTAVGTSAFADCPKFKTINFKGTPEEFAAITWANGNPAKSTFTVNYIN